MFDNAAPANEDIDSLYPEGGGSADSGFDAASKGFDLSRRLIEDRDRETEGLESCESDFFSAPLDAPSVLALVLDSDVGIGTASSNLLLFVVVFGCCAEPLEPLEPPKSTSTQTFTGIMKPSGFSSCLAGSLRCVFSALVLAI